MYFKKICTYHKFCYDEILRDLEHRKPDEITQDTLGNSFEVWFVPIVQHRVQSVFGKEYSDES